jgi:hypothetical protein
MITALINKSESRHRINSVYHGINNQENDKGENDRNRGDNGGEMNDD